VYIVDPVLKLVPIGVAGEILVGGAGLSRGYLNRPELTARSFIAHPFKTQPGAFVYRTGDLAHRLSDGNIVFSGRRDHQVKVQGFRIELGEIEVVLAQDRGVREAVVLAREDESGERRLIAYVVPTQRPAPSVSRLRRFLLEKLPEYMVPSAFVILEALPLTPNGKVDRRALPSPDQARPELDDAYVAPRTPIEEGMARLFGEVLHLERVGIHDNFFDLGGHSLMATQLISRVQATYQVDLPLQRIFKKPTVAGLAALIEEMLVEQEDDQEMGHLLAELEGLSEDEVRKLLAEETATE
jgi:acyl carrier protein